LFDFLTNRQDAKDAKKRREKRREEERTKSIGIAYWLAGASTRKASVCCFSGVEE
jgi:hypothetical protein